MDGWMDGWIDMKLSFGLGDGGTNLQRCGSGSVPVELLCLKKSLPCNGFEATTG